MPNDPPMLRRSVIRYFEAPIREWAVDALRTYCEGRTDDDAWLYSGAWFDRLAARSHPDAFTADDLVSVTMLSVAVPPHAAIKLLTHDGNVFSSLLAAIGPNRPIWETPEADLEEGSPADELWHRLKDLHGVGPVIAGKLLAAKRPGLIPIYDQHVRDALGWPKGHFWVAMQASMTEAHGAVTDAIADAKVNVTPLRAVDIVVWMHQHGWKSAASRLEPPPSID